MSTDLRENEPNHGLRLTFFSAPRRDSARPLVVHIQVLPQVTQPAGSAHPQKRYYIQCDCAYK